MVLLVPAQTPFPPFPPSRMQPSAHPPCWCTLLCTVCLPLHNIVRTFNYIHKIFFSPLLLFSRCSLFARDCKDHLFEITVGRILPAKKKNRYSLDIYIFWNSVNCWAFLSNNVVYANRSNRSNCRMNDCTQNRNMLPLKTMKTDRRFAGKLKIMQL